MGIDVALAVQDGVFGALNVEGVTDLAQVTQHVLEETDLPLVVIGRIELTPEGGKGGGLDRASVEVLTYVREPRRAALYELQHAVRTALEGAQLVADGAELSPPELVSRDDGLLEDGQTYEGTQIFALYVQPA
ncbi:MAG TPA: DUF3168 domain-containing protein [Allosphingosinicella sp.]|jgi:hypothetical protein